MAEINKVTKYNKMKLEQPKTTEFKKELLEDGAYAARVYSVIDLGTQESEYNGEKKLNRKVEISLEIPSETITYEKDGEEVTAPQTLHKKYNVTMFEKGSLYPIIKAGFGKVEEGLDLMELVGKEMMLSVSRKEFQKDGKTIEFVNIDTATALPKGMTVDTQINDSVVFDLDKFDANVFNGLKDWTKEIIQKSPEMDNALAGKDETKSEEESGVADDFDALK